VLLKQRTPGILRHAAEPLSVHLQLSTTPPRSLSHSPRPSSAPQMSGSLFDEVFKIDEINPDAKKFDEGAQRPHFCLSTHKSSGQ
jgi:hypothetical protein